MRISTLPNITWWLKYIYIFGLLLGGWGCGSNISPLSTSLKYWLLPSHKGGTTCGSRRIDCQTDQGTCISTCEKFPPITQLSNTLPVHFLGSHGEINCVTWSLVRPREKCCPTGQQLGDLDNSLLVRLVTSKAAHLNPRESVHLRGRGKLTRRCFCDNHLCLANLPNWYTSGYQDKVVEYTLSRDSITSL